MTPAGPPQDIRPPLGERREATQGGQRQNPGPSLAELLPHAGAMVLLDEVIAWDEQHISCRTRSHRNPANPLARDGVLPIWAGIEYAAQAMAAHFALQSGAQGAATAGLFGGLRDVVCAAARLDDVDTPLIVAATRVAFDPAGSIYDFLLTAEAGGRELLRGRATVVQRQTRDPT